MRLIDLFEESKIRGLHAFGIAHYERGEIVCDRFLNREHAKWYLLECVAAHYGEKEPMKLIAHCRYSTSGDWHNSDANQPVVIGELAMAFNGVIRMTTKEQWGKEFGFEPITDNDGEIFARKVLAGEDWETWVAMGAFSFAGVMLYHGKLLALRNRQRPLYHVRDGSSHYIGSTQDIFKRAKFKLPKAIQPGITFHVG